MSTASGSAFPPIFLISLDFELYWGVRDTRSLAEYRENLLGVRRVVPRLLKVFSEFGVHATWATVGFLFFENKRALLAGLPSERPEYDDKRKSPYEDLATIGNDEASDPFHFGRSLIEQVVACPNQEIATHTFSHYYCLEPQRNLEAFRADLTAARKAAAKLGMVLQSIVFPRNQYDQRHLQVCKEAGFTAFRGNPASWMYQPCAAAADTRLRRLGRFVDSYWSSRVRSYSPSQLEHEPMWNVPASRFFRPYNPKIPRLARVQEKRIFEDLRIAAENGRMYHLWWHPHNFGANIDENIASLTKILSQFGAMRRRFGMQSLSMHETAMLIGGDAENRSHDQQQYCAVRKAG